MANKIETSYSGMFLNTRLKNVLNDLNKELIESRLVTKEEVANLFNKAVRDYQKSLGKSLFEHQTYSVGIDPDVSKLNSDFNTIHSDLNILYNSLRNTRNLLASNYNTLSGMALKLKADIAEASSKLFDYKLQNTNKLTPSFSDSFYDLSKIEKDEGKYSKPKAFVDTFNSNVVLPLNKEAEGLKVKKVSIVDDSIGISGNNEEVGGLARDNLKLAVDNSIDTWFEFEQVGVNELGSPTVLNLKLELEEESFFNLLDIAVVQMPNGSYPSILDIKGSTDGSTFFDLKSLFLGELEVDSVGNQVIQLGENEQNPNGSNLLYFSPRKVKYITVKLIEDSSFFIKTPSGIKYRRAIGIKELKPKSQKFKTQGQFISSNFESNKEISKISLSVKEYLPSSFKTDFKYFISIDNGLNWEPIGPSEKINEDIPEVLSYNIDFLEDSKRTDVPVTTVKLKADFSIEEGEDDTTTTSSFKTTPQTEFITINSGQKYINLQEKPYGEVNIYKTNYGSVGKETFLKTLNSSLKELDDRYLLQLPIDVFGPNSIQKDQDYLLIDNYVWTRVDEITSSNTSDDLIYEFDYTNNIVTFHKEINGSRYGRKPSGDIFFKLKRENVLLEKRADKTYFKTGFNHDAIKENISIYSIDEELSESNYRLKNRSSVHRLGVEEIEGIQIVKDNNNTLEEEKGFVNGVIELTDPGDYSIDKKRGVLYTYNTIGAEEDLQIKVQYRTKNKVQFDLKAGEIYSVQELERKNQDFVIDIPSETYSVDLGYKNIEERSIIFSTLPSSIQKEVPYEDIESEFNMDGTSGKYAIDYRNGILYLQDKVNGRISGSLVNSNYYIEYNITQKIPETSYQLSAEEKRITLSDKYVSDLFNSTNSEVVPPSLVKVEYVFAEEVKESTSELLPYTTPFLMEYKIKVVPKESL